MISKIFSFGILVCLLFCHPVSASTPPLDKDRFAPELVNIPAGTFRMGSNNGDGDEKPVREVTLPEFAMSRTEVTLGWYLRCMADRACEAPAWWSIGYFEDVPSQLTPAQRSQLPITGVSWRQAKLFCAWLGAEYDLPSEAEWEYAAGGGKNWKYPWGDDAAGRFRCVRPRYLTPTGDGVANPFGLYDFGRVWEWVDDCYELGTHASRKDGACAQRVTKGGSWTELIWNLRVANKSFGLPDEGYKGLGFRVVRHAR